MPFDSEIGSVKLYSPSALGKPWRVTWTPPGMTRQVKDRETKVGAEKLAKEIKGQLKRGEVVQSSKAADAPWLADVVGWLVPIVWVIWGIGVILGLLLTLIAQWGVNRFIATHP